MEPQNWRFVRSQRGHFEVPAFSFREGTTILKTFERPYKNRFCKKVEIHFVKLDLFRIGKPRHFTRDAFFVDILICIEYAQVKLDHFPKYRGKH